MTRRWLWLRAHTCVVAVLRIRGALDDHPLWRLEAWVWDRFMAATRRDHARHPERYRT